MVLIIQWYPGHMVKAKRLVQENLKLVDVVVELVDARIPQSSRNPDINKILCQKPRVIALNKADLADKGKSILWQEYFKEQGFKAIPINAINGQGISQLIQAIKQLGQPVLEALAAKGRRPRPIRVMIVGIPNVGKSSLINKMVGKGTAQTGDKPGVTRGKQWIKLASDLELLDTPGILWPKFEDPEVGRKLAFTGAISDDIMDLEELALELAKLLKEVAPETLMERFNLKALSDIPEEIIEAIGAKRGCLISGGRIDHLKASRVILGEFRTGKLGNLTLELPGTELRPSESAGPGLSDSLKPRVFDSKEETLVDKELE